MKRIIEIEHIDENFIKVENEKIEIVKLPTNKTKYFFLNGSTYKILSNTQAKKIPKYKVKAKCVSCNIVSFYFKGRGVRIEDRQCLVCNGPVERTSSLLKGYRNVYEEY